MKETSVLDFVKSRLMPWKYPRVEIPSAESLPGAVSQAQATGQEQVDQETPPSSDLAKDFAHPITSPDQETQGQGAQGQEGGKPERWPWRSLLALFLALVGQFSLRPVADRSWLTGTVLLAAAISTFYWAYLRREWRIEEDIEEITGTPAPTQFTLNIPRLLIGTVLAIFAFLSFGGLEFSLLNSGLLVAAIFFIARSMWVQSPTSGISVVKRLAHLRSRIHFSWPGLLGAAGIAWVIFFRYFLLGRVPPEMNSDHAEKILDVLRLLSGETSIFFAANGGREALQFYLVAGLHKFLGIPLGFDILKLVTITVGFLALPFIYLIGKEIANRRVGLIAFLFAGIAYWPNVVSRAAMRLPFYMLFTAAILFFLIRGIRRSRRNDFIWAGILLGLSLYGYSADRILPLVVLLAVGLYLLHRQSHQRKQFTLIATLALIFISLVVFLPLLRYVLSEPDAFLFRTLTRLGNLEKPLEQAPWIIFLNNLGRALAMFSWSDGEVWVVSIPHYPALGIVAGALFYLGVVVVFIRYIRQRNWLDLFWLLSIPALMLPSILSLAFPHENPNLYRTGGAIVPVFIMIAFALEALMQALIAKLPGRTGVRLAWGLALMLFLLSSMQDYSLVFNRYYDQYQMSAWNTSEMGQVARNFINTIGAPDCVWVVGYAHWVDTRLVALNAGYPGRDFQIFVDQLESTQAEQRAKLFIINLADRDAIQMLSSMYPSGWIQLYTSKVPSKDFLIFIVPPR